MKKIISTVLLGGAVAFTSVMPASAVVNAIPETEEAYELTDFDLVDFGADGLGEFVFVESAAAIKPCPSGTFKVRRSTRTKKKVINSAIAGAIGTAIGAGVGGKRGALLGAGTGAGGYLVYRYVRDRRGRCVRSYR